MTYLVRLYPPDSDKLLNEITFGEEKRQNKRMKTWINWLLVFDKTGKLFADGLPSLLACAAMVKSDTQICHTLEWCTWKYHLENLYWVYWNEIITAKGRKQARGHV